MGGGDGGGWKTRGRVPAEEVFTNVTSLAVWLGSRRFLRDDTGRSCTALGAFWMSAARQFQNKTELSRCLKHVWQGHE